MAAMLVACLTGLSCLLGCTTAPPLPLASGTTQPRRAVPGLGWLDPSRNATDPMLTDKSNEVRAGSTLGQPAASATTSAVDPRALNEVMAQLRSIGEVDPATQTRLMDDLRKTDPSLWPLVMQSYRSTMAYQTRASAAPGPNTRADAGGAYASTGLPPETADGRQVSAAATAEAAQNGPKSSPWNALAVPVAAQTNQTALKDGSQPSNGSGIAALAAADVAKPTSAPAQASPPAAASGEPALLPAIVATPIPQAAPAANGAGPAAADTSAVQPASYTSAAADPNADAELASAIATLEKQAATPARGAADVSRQISLRMLYLAAGRREQAVRPIEGLSPPEQEYWNKQLASLAMWLDDKTVPDAGQRAAAAHQVLTQAATHLGQIGPLAVRNVAFCTEVASYGVVTRFKETEFTPGQQVLLYAEVDNYKSVETPQGFQTALKSSYQIVDKQGAKMAGAEPQTMEEFCQNPRRDYFVRYRLNLPKPLPDGTYTLQLTIEDTLSQKVGKSSLDFVIKDKK
jgi:hypothetical protein